MTNTDICKRINKYLNSNEDPLEKLSALSNVFNFFTPTEFYLYYKNNSDQFFIDFKLQKAFLCETISNMPTVVKFLDNNFYSRVLIDYFINVNKVEDEYIIFNTELNTTTISEEFFSNRQDLKYLDNLIYSINTERITNMISEGKISPWLFQSIKFPLNKHTFQYHLHQIENYSHALFPIDSLLTYRLTYHEWINLLTIVKNNRAFHNKILSALKKTDIRNTTTYIFSVILNYTLNLSEFQLDYKELTHLVCCTHNKSMRPYSTFCPIEDLSKAEVYLIYLMSKINITQEPLEIVHNTFTGIKEDVVSKEVYKVFEEEEENVVRASLSGSTLTSSFSNEFDRFLYKHYKSKNCKETIMDLIFQSDDLSFNYSLFSFFINFPQKEYYEKMFMIYGVQIIESGISPSDLQTNKVYEDFCKIYYFINPNKELILFSDYTIDLSNIEYTEDEVDRKEPALRIEEQLVLPLVRINTYFCFTPDERRKVIKNYEQQNLDEDILYEYRIYKTGNTLCTQKCTDFNNLLHANFFQPKNLADIFSRKKLAEEYDFSDIGETVKLICEKYKFTGTLIQNIQRYLFCILDKMKVTEEDLFLLEEIFGILAKSKSIKCRTYNEIIFRKIIRIARIMDKEVVIGNVR